MRLQEFPGTSDPAYTTGIAKNMISSSHPSIPVHKGKPIKQGLLRDQLEKAGLTMEEFLKLYR